MGSANPTYQQCLSSTGGPAYDGYKVAGYWYADDKTTINNCNPCRGRQVQVVKTDGRWCRSQDQVHPPRCPQAKS